MFSKRVFAGSLTTTLITMTLLANGIARGAGPPFEVSATSDLVRVFEDGYGRPSQTSPEIRAFGLRNEVISAQFVVAAHENLNEVTVAIGPLKQAEGSATIPSAHIRWNLVESIFIAENTPKLRQADLIRPAPARFPDYLSQERHCALAEKSLKAVYLTISIPRDAQPGEYRAEVAVTCSHASIALPLILTVYPLTLPDQRHLMVTEWFSTNRLKQHHGVDTTDRDQFLRMLQVYAENMAEHRQNVFRVNMDLVQTTRSADGELHFDFSRFDRWAEVFWATGRMDLLETGFIARFGKGGWSSREILLRDFPVNDESTSKTMRLSGEEFLPKFLPALVAHLREKQWLEKTVFHICDEPSDHNVMAWREASDFVHRHAPQLRRVDAIETPHCLNRLEVWVPKLDHLATWQPAYEEAQRQGNELWFYTVGIFQNGSLPNKTVDVPLIESRVMHWLNYRYGLQGYLHWGYNAWTDDPVNDPGQHRGDGWQVYPTNGGLLNSLRWEQMRNGIQDYESLWLLEDKISQIRQTLSPRVAALIQPRRRGVEIASQVVRTYSDYTRDPAVLYAARRQVLDELLGLDATPRVILQTNPLELSTVANDCAIDVHGWAEPGTRIQINNRPTPVEPDGLFLMQVPPTSEGTITLKAENEKGSKTMLRRFHLLY
jgi:hypothetical protein